MSGKQNKPETRSCSCCGVKFRQDLCPQCYVAGCAHKGKGKPCRLNSDTQKTQQLSEFQVREAYAKLLEEHRKIVEEAQRLVRIIYAKDPTLLENFSSAVVAHAIPGQIKSNGHAEFPPQPSVPKTPDSWGENRHG